MQAAGIVEALNGLTDMREVLTTDSAKALNDETLKATSRSIINWSFGM